MQKVKGLHRLSVQSKRTILRKNDFLKSRTSSFSLASAEASLIEWAHLPSDNSKIPAVEIEHQESTGRCLTSCRDVEPGEVLLSVPFPKVFAGEADGEMHWSAAMAVRLLHECHEAQQASTGTWGPWLGLLPPAEALHTPIEFTSAEVAEIQYPDTQQEVEGMQQCLLNCYEVVEAELKLVGAGWEDFLWGVQVFHSRCFFEPNMRLHMCVPGVDMANHSSHPNAEVRMVHNPDACQGGSAVEDVCDAPPPSPSRFELVCGASSIRAEEEVTISYGHWPNDVFFELFGFVPDKNLDDSILLYQEPDELVLQYLEMAGVHQPEVQQRIVSGVLSRLQGGEDKWGRLVVTWEGLDWRLQELVGRTVKQLLSSAITCPDIAASVLVTSRCRQLQGSFPTSIQEDEALLGGGKLSQRMELIVRFRLGKKRLIQHVLAVYGQS